MYNIFIISPSGQFYGSEQVLHNFLEGTLKSYKVYVPQNSIFEKILKQQSQHVVSLFTTLSGLYIRIFFQIIVGKCQTLYVNEGGHIRYIKLLAHCFSRKQFFVHIRLLEDCNPERLGKLPKNIQLISISQFISEQLKPYKATLIYDPLNTKGLKDRKNFPLKAIYKIGIIGRVSPSKGLAFYREFFNYLKSTSSVSNYEFLFFGDLHTHIPEVKEFYEFCQSCGLAISFKGFVADQNQIYNAVDVVLHLNPSEPLGRIGLESWARGIPFIGFNEGGVGEINLLLEQDTSCVCRNKNWPELLEDKLNNLFIFITPEVLQKAKEGVQTVFGVKRYVNQLEELLKSVKN